MTIKATHGVTNATGDYKSDLIALLRHLENSGQLPDPKPYYDSAKKNSLGQYQNVTIGDGINIDWNNLNHLKLVLDQIGLVDSSTTQEINRRAAAGLPAETTVERAKRLNDMVSAFQMVMSANRPSVTATSTVVNAATSHLQSQLDYLSAHYGGGKFELSPSQSEAVIRHIIDGNVNIPEFLVINKGKEARLDAILGNTGATAVLPHDSKEYVAVMSMFYNAARKTGTVYSFIVGCRLKG